MFCVRKISVYLILALLAITNRANAGIVSSHKLSLSVGFIADRQRGTFNVDNVGVDGKTSSWLQKPRSSVYLGVGYNVYFDVFRAIKPFVGLDVQWRQSFIKNNVFNEEAVVGNMREVGVASAKIGLKFNLIGLQPYFLFGTNLAKLSFELPNGLKNNGQYDFGYSIGCGIEWMFASIVGIRAEYRHTINDFKNNVSFQNIGNVSTKIKSNNILLGVVLLI